MEANEEDIATFQAITGVDHETAEHVLEAHGWDLNRGLNFYMESSATGNDHAPRSRLHSPGDQTPGATPYLSSVSLLVRKQKNLVERSRKILCMEILGVFQL